MNINQVKHELQNILPGKSSQSYEALIQTTTSYFRGSQSSSILVKNKFENKAEETKALISYAKRENLLYENIDIKDYFHNLLLHNYFFADTAYQFLGFYIDDKEFYAVVKQPFIKADNFTNLTNVKSFLTENGFENTRNHDYFHPQLGIILEDLHDENVLTKKDTLYFIDTVFYIKPEIFWINKED